MAPDPAGTAALVQKVARETIPVNTLATSAAAGVMPAAAELTKFRTVGVQRGARGERKRRRVGKRDKRASRANGDSFCSFSPSSSHCPLARVKHVCHARPAAAVTPPGAMQ